MDSEAGKAKACGQNQTDLWQVTWRMVHLPDTPAEILHDLCNQAPEEVLERIAEHPNVKLETLAMLARHPCPSVRAAVGENPLSPHEIVSTLIDDECADVRYSLAENCNLSPDHLLTLCSDENPYVSWRARRTLQRLLCDDYSLVEFPERHEDSGGREASCQ